MLICTRWDRYVDRLERVLPGADKVRGDIILWLIRFSAIVPTYMASARSWRTYIYNIALEPLELLNFFFFVSIIQRVKTDVVSFRVYLIIITTTCIKKNNNNTHTHSQLIYTASCVFFLCTYFFFAEKADRQRCLYVHIDCNIK